MTADSVRVVCTEAIRIPTVSYSPTDINATALHEFSRLLRKGRFKTTHDIIKIVVQSVFNCGAYVHLFCRL